MHCRDCLQRAQEFKFITSLFLIIFITKFFYTTASILREIVPRSWFLPRAGIRIGHVSQELPVHTPFSTNNAIMKVFVHVNVDIANYYNTVRFSKIGGFKYPVVLFSQYSIAHDTAMFFQTLRPHPSAFFLLLTAEHFPWIQSAPSCRQKPNEKPRRV